MFTFSAFTVAIAIGGLLAVGLLLSILFRRVVSTNVVHIIQRGHVRVRNPNAAVDDEVRGVGEIIHPLRGFPATHLVLVNPLVPVVTGKQKLYVAVDRMADIRAVLALKAEYPKLDLVLVGATEGWLVASDIAAAGVPVIANGLIDLPETFEQLGATQSNAGRMAKAGVKVAINAATMQDPRRLQQVAGNLVALTRIPGASGMEWGKAFAAISSVPAEISGMGGKAGVLKAGALGDVVLWTGDPLEVGSVPTRVFIGGVEQDLTNHQTRLRDRYIDLDESDRPKAYDW